MNTVLFLNFNSHFVLQSTRTCASVWWESHRVASGTAELIEFSTDGSKIDSTKHFIQWLVGSQKHVWMDLWKPMETIVDFTVWHNGRIESQEYFLLIPWHVVLCDDQLIPCSVSIWQVQLPAYVTSGTIETWASLGFARVFPKDCVRNVSWNQFCCYQFITQSILVVSGSSRTTMKDSVRSIFCWWMSSIVMCPSGNNQLWLPLGPVLQ